MDNSRIMSNIMIRLCRSLSFLSQKRIIREREILCKLCVRCLNVDTFVNCTGVSRSDAKTIIEKYPLVKATNNDQLPDTIRTFENLGYSIEAVLYHPNLLSLSGQTITSNFLSLKELGAQDLKLADFINYKMIRNKKLSLARAHGIIPLNCNVIQCSLSQIKSLSKEDAKIIEQNINIENIEEKTLLQIQKLLKLHYLSWRFNTEENHIENIIKKYPRINNKPISMIAEIVEILINQFQCSTELILRNGCLLHAHTAVINEYMRELPNICGVELSIAARHNPRILLNNTKKSLDIIAFLKKVGFKDKTIGGCLRILTLSLQTIQDRIVKALQDPYFNMFKWHPHFLNVILYNKMSRDRLNAVREMNMKCYSFQTISGASFRGFEKFKSGREDRTRGTDTVAYLVKILNCERSSLRLYLTRHPNWLHIPFETVHNNLKLLARYGFYPCDIRKSIHIIFYPTENIEEILSSLDYNKPNDAVDWSNEFNPDIVVNNINDINEPIVKFPDDSFFKDHMKYKEGSEFNFSIKFDSSINTSLNNSVIEWSHVLPYCLYLLEKPHHFSGDGVWVTNQESLSNVN